MIKAGRLLGKTYKGYGWMVRAIGGKDPNDFGIGIALAELIQFFGTRATMYLNPNDYATELEFEAMVKKLGGELLERARLTKKKDEQVTKMPDGFEEFAPKVSYKLLNTVDQVVDAVNTFTKTQEKEASITNSDELSNNGE